MRKCCHIDIDRRDGEETLCEVTQIGCVGMVDCIGSYEGRGGN